MDADRLEKEPNSESPENSPSDAVPVAVAVPVFRGSRAASFEFGLVLDAKGLAYDRAESGGEWLLLVAPAVAEVASDELARYTAERTPRRQAPTPFIPFHGSALGAAVYAFVLILTAY
jgi:hypothetical protein